MGTNAVNTATGAISAVSDASTGIIVFTSRAANLDIGITALNLDVAADTEFAQVPRELPWIDGYLEDPRRNTSEDVDESLLPVPGWPVMIAG